MKKNILRLGIAGLMSSVALVGCQHKQSCCSTCCDSKPAAHAHVAAKPIEAKTLPVVDDAELGEKLTPVEPAKPAAEKKPTWSGGRKDDGRRTYRDITAHPSFSHAADYSWLVGELQYVALDKAWVLRFASAEEEDPYGGSVTLLEPRPLAGFKSGMLVRVEGQLVDPEAKGTRPPYRLHMIQPVEASTAQR